MGMKETPGSLQAYFIVAGVISHGSNLKDIGNARGVVLALLVVGAALGLAFLVAGLQIKKELPKGAGWILQLLIGVIIVELLELGLYVGLVGTPPPLVSVPIGVAVLISLYLYANVKRLARESQR